MSEALRAELLVLLPVLVGGGAKLLLTYIQSRLTPNRLATVHDLARIAVNAAEKLATDNPGTVGADKFAFASRYLVEAAKKLGLKLTSDEVMGFIHSALKEMTTIDSLQAGATGARF